MLLAMGLIACDSAPTAADDVSPDEESAELSAGDESSGPAVRDACYHIEVSGDRETSVTCADYRRREAGDHLVIQIGDHATTLRISFPDDLQPDEYDLSDHRDEVTAEAELSLVDDDGERHRFRPREGSLSVMHVDDESISALFDFTAQLDEPALTIDVRGHLRDLEL